MDPSSGNLSDLLAWLREQDWTEVPLGLEGESKWEKSGDDPVQVHLGRAVNYGGVQYVPTSVYRGGRLIVETNGATPKWLEEHTG